MKAEASRLDSSKACSKLGGFIYCHKKIYANSQSLMPFYDINLCDHSISGPILGEIYQVQDYQTKKWTLSCAWETEPVHSGQDHGFACEEGS